MNDAYFLRTKRLDDELPIEIPWLTNAQACIFLKVSGATRRRDAEVLREMGIPGFPSHWKNRSGYNRQVLEVLHEFYQLKNLTDRTEAIDKIKPLMEALYAKRRQRTGAAC